MAKNISPNEWAYVTSKSKSWGDVVNKQYDEYNLEKLEKIINSTKPRKPRILSPLAPGWDLRWIRYTDEDMMDAFTRYIVYHRCASPQPVILRGIIKPYKLNGEVLPGMPSWHKGLLPVKCNMCEQTITVKDVCKSVFIEKMEKD